MRLVTWSVDHGSGGRHRPDDFLTALEALGPDILVLVNRGTGALLKPLREAVAGIGLVHQLAPDAATPHRPLLIASRLELVRGSLPGGGDAASAPPNALHVYAPGGILDVLSLKAARQVGTHQELLSHGGIYYKLYQLQYKEQEIRQAV